MPVRHQDGRYGSADVLRSIEITEYVEPRNSLKGNIGNAEAVARARVDNHRVQRRTLRNGIQVSAAQNRFADNGGSMLPRIAAYRIIHDRHAGLPEQPDKGPHSADQRQNGTLSAACSYLLHRAAVPSTSIVELPYWRMKSKPYSL